jgi:hypothetical protein
LIVINRLRNEPGATRQFNVATHKKCGTCSVRADYAAHEIPSPIEGLNFLREALAQHAALKTSA